MCPDTDKALNCYQLLLAYGAPEDAKDAVSFFDNLFIPILIKLI